VVNVFPFVFRNPYRLECKQNQECHHQCEQGNRFCQCKSHNTVSE